MKVIHNFKARSFQYLITKANNLNLFDLITPKTSHKESNDYSYSQDQFVFSRFYRISSCRMETCMRCLLQKTALTSLKSHYTWLVVLFSPYDINCTSIDICFLELSYIFKKNTVCSRRSILLLASRLFALFFTLLSNHFEKQNLIIEWFFDSISLLCFESVYYLLQKI